MSIKMMSGKVNTASGYCYLYFSWLSSQSQSNPPFGQYQILVFDDRGTCVNDLPRVVTWQRNGWESNPHPVTVTPPNHTHIRTSK